MVKLGFKLGCGIPSYDRNLVTVLASIARMPQSSLIFID
ncbi:MAG: hypothetical protein OJF52_004315 [Nitrospira sp.]|nr:MAG: hypothetical protein OJF52_004315 [Nitrospira sp.]